ncbi:murein L,D-transpeptidase catalytic domain family protein [Bacteriovorax sp. PP10]|uniref:Murein L,D-transpeptidase catalytic domain family protein n=1 Tax=Bacteriovorax antarcticus TaxID=3088717 RepID=A0ABU5VXQ0_9BACT|nr:murein L,D-transpeptidase catalytic domain family protein [Bacteriovorax sp. PP10]MEA9357832.1 murein L,D-transpeptidase catalytic domain family protein [Bacteriovorax sp. PP10]
MSFSAPVHAEISFSSGWQSLLRFLHLDIKKEVNSYVTPPERQCTDQNVGRAIANTPPPEPPTMPEEPILTGAASDDGASSMREKIMENYTKLGGDPIALEQSLCFFDKNKGVKFKAAGDPSRSGGISIDNQRYITINDLNVTMSKSRMFVIDMETGKVNTYFSAHGYGGKKGVPESDMMAEGVSNVDGSNASPRGFFITGTRREGSSDPRWKFSMKLHGLQQGVNDKSFSRAIIMHPFPKMPEESASSDDPNVSGAIRSEGPFSLSQGCTMLSENYASDIINKIKTPSNSKGGSLYYNYSAEEKSRGASYCGDEGLMKK